MNINSDLINQQNQQLKNQNRSLNWKSELEIRTGNQNRKSEAVLKFDSFMQLDNMRLFI